MRRWRDGDTGTLDGVRYRVVRGAKGPDDLRLDWLIGGKWRAVHMRVAAMLADFFYENEDALYPPPRYKGGRKVLTYLRHAGLHGWEKAEAGLRVERNTTHLQATLFDADTLRDIREAYDE